MGEKFKQGRRGALARFGFTISEKRENVCLACRQLARSPKGGAGYSVGNRAMKVVVHGMMAIESQFQD